MIRRAKEKRHSIRITVEMTLTEMKKNMFRRLRRLFCFQHFSSCNISLLCSFCLLLMVSYQTIHSGFMNKPCSATNQHGSVGIGEASFLIDGDFCLQRTTYQCQITHKTSFYIPKFTFSNIYSMLYVFRRLT